MDIKEAIKDLLNNSIKEFPRLGIYFSAHSVGGFTFWISKTKHLNFNIVFRFVNNHYTTIDIEIFLDQREYLPIKHVLKKTFDFSGSDNRKEEVYKEFQATFKSFVLTYNELYNTYTLCK